jgi:hypothetical protein
MFQAEKNIYNKNLVSPQLKQIFSVLIINLESQPLESKFLNVVPSCFIKSSKKKGKIPSTYVESYQLLINVEMLDTK